MPDEAGTVANLAAQDLAPGQYMVPHAGSPEAMKEERVRKAFEEGAAGFITILPRGIPNMGPNMALSAVFNIAVAVPGSVRSVPDAGSRCGLHGGLPGHGRGRLDGLRRRHGTGCDLVRRPWSSVCKGFGDALIYGLLTGGAFGWLWS